MESGEEYWSTRYPAALPLGSWVGRRVGFGVGIPLPLLCSAPLSLFASDLVQNSLIQHWEMRWVLGRYFVSQHPCPYLLANKGTQKDFCELLPIWTPFSLDFAKYLAHLVSTVDHTRAVISLLTTIISWGNNIRVAELTAVRNHNSLCPPIHLFGIPKEKMWDGNPL